ncbi:hypothetical protein PM082_002193 [Marasmius tenuissimus]|nr:hypothetical protein PM082_002193 [Marasmius tenuissimus]
MKLEQWSFQKDVQNCTGFRPFLCDSTLLTKFRPLSPPDVLVFTRIDNVPTQLLEPACLSLFIGFQRPRLVYATAAASPRTQENDPLWLTSY